MEIADWYNPRTRQEGAHKDTRKKGFVDGNALGVHWAGARDKG